MNKYKYILIALFACIPMLLSALPEITKVTVVNGSCKNGGKITIQAKNLGTDVKYAILGTEGDAKDYYLSKETNVFEDLPSGKYSIMLYDSATGSTPVTSTAVVENKYTDLTINNPSTAYPTPAEECGGSLTLSYRGGKSPYTCVIKNEDTGYEETKVSNSNSAKFTNLSAGKYSAVITDFCGTTLSMKASDLSEVKTLENTTFTSLDIVPNYFQGNGVCEKITLVVMSPGLIINGSTTLHYDYYNTIKFRMITPANAILADDEGWKVGESGYRNLKFDINDYDSQSPGDYRIEMMHPCTQAIISSPVYQLPKYEFKFSHYTRIEYEDFCALPSQMQITINNDGKEILNYDCAGFTVELTPKDGGVSTTYDWDEDSYFQIKNIPINQYDIVIKKDGVQVGKLTTSKIIPAYAYAIPYLGNYTDYQVTCDFTRFTPKANYIAANSAVSTNNLNDVPVTFTILSGPEMREPITVLKAGANLWDNLLFGSYKIKIDYGGCRTETKDFNLSQPIDRFEGQPPVINATVSCGNYDVTCFGRYYAPNGNNVGYNYSAFIVKINEDGSETFIESAKSLNTNNSAYIPSNIGGKAVNIKPGKYKFRYSAGLPYASNIPCHLVEYDLDIPEYVLPTVDVAHSGGTTCETGLGRLTINATGSNEPFEYRYRKSGDPEQESSYTSWQTANFFNNLSTGSYVVEVSDGCGSKKETLNIFNGTDQFLELRGGYDSNTVCKGMNALLTVKSIGPVDWYKWYKGDVLIDGADEGEYILTDMDETKAGRYKVVVYNGTCELESFLDINVMDVLELKDDLATVPSFETKLIDVLANDLIAACYPTGCPQTLTTAKIQVEGYAKGVVEGAFGKIEIVDNKVQFTAPERFDDGVVKFTYDVECELEGVKFEGKGNVSVFILQYAGSVPSICNGNGYTVFFYEFPPSITGFKVMDGATQISLPHTYPNLTTNKTLQVTPSVAGLEYPTVDYTIYVIPTTVGKVRWKGTTDYSWNNPKNWVLIKADGSDGAAIAWVPSHCIDIEIPTASPRYPKLTTSSSSVNDIDMKDRAMLGNTHFLRYNSVKMDIKFDASESDRWVMYSAPIKSSYSGDFMFLTGVNQPIKQASYMSLFQSVDPDSNSAAEDKTITRPFANVEQKMEFGKAFFLKVDAAKANSRTYSFPRTETKYTYYLANNWGTTITTPIESGALTRTAKGRFLLDDANVNPDYDITLVSPNDMEGSEVVMVVNPFTSYLNIKSFLKFNESQLEQGYKIWSGTPDSFIKVNETDNTLKIIDPDQIKNNVPTDTDYIAPMQSFFVLKKNKDQKATLRFRPEIMTTVEPVGIAGDYKLK